MKNINKTKINVENIQSYVEYEVMNGENIKVLNSLGNPETSIDAFNFVKNIVEKSNKLSKIIPTDNENIIYKIIMDSFLNNRKIGDQLSIYSQQLAPKIALVRVETGSVIAQYANKAYQPINNIDFNNPTQQVA